MLSEAFVLVIGSQLTTGMLLLWLNSRLSAIEKQLEGDGD